MSTAPEAAGSPGQRGQAAGPPSSLSSRWAIPGARAALFLSYRRAWGWGWGRRGCVCCGCWNLKEQQFRALSSRFPF